MAKLELALLVGDESKEFLANLTKQIDRLEGLKAKLAAPEEKEEDESVEDDEEEEAPKAKAAKKKPAAEEDEDDAELEADDEADEEEEKPKAKGKAKPKKVTIDDVNDACKAKAAATSRKDVLTILKKKFKVDTVSDLDPDDYQDVLEAMKVEDDED